METLAEALPKEMARVRDKLLPVYDQIPAGKIAATMMRASLDSAARAMVEGDLVAMIQCYQSLKDYSL